MNKSELIAAAAERSGMAKKDTERVLNAVLKEMTACLARGEKVQLSGFGAFEVKEREARVARNPRTNEPMAVPATQVPVFKPSQTLKETVGKEAFRKE